MLQLMAIRETVLDWSTAKIQNMENGIRIPLFQDGIIHVWPAISVVDELDDLVAELNVEG